MKNLLSFLTLLSLGLFGGVSAFAQDTGAADANESTPPGKVFKNAINACPIAPVFGVFSINYERMLNQTHGVVIRYDYESVPDAYTDANMESSGNGIIVNYRWHRSHSMKSIFLGVYARYRVYTGTGMAEATPFDFTISEQTLGLNVGKRWIMDNGLNLTFALGYGIFNTTNDADPTNDSIDSALESYKDENNFFNPGYGELSIGYAF